MHIYDVITKGVEPSMVLEGMANSKALMTEWISNYLCLIK
jgi:hypothetical protein